jgi:hypothetical protein
MASSIPNQLIWRVALGVALSVPLACGEEENPEPSSTFTTGPGSSSSGNQGGGNDGGGGVGGNCEGPNGCFDCPPTQNVHFLNACTDAQCAFFDNEARLPLYEGPDLPPIP